MGKKRKARETHTDTSGPRGFEASESKLRISTYEDIADSEDEFHINRDKIFLEEGLAHKRQRKYLEEGL